MYIEISTNWNLTNSFFPKYGHKSIGFLLTSFLVILLISFSGEANGLRCFQCLRLSCDSSTICESIKLSMSQIFYPRRQNIEFNPNDTCPEFKAISSNSTLGATAWNAVSVECSKSDSICLQAEIEVVSSINGLKDSYELDRFYEMKSKGVLRGCASRRFLLSMSEETFDVKAENVNGTLGSINQPKDKYTVNEIQFHHFYIDHGTGTAVKCYDDNCNQRAKRSAATKNSKYHSNNRFLIFSILLLFCSYKGS